MAIFAAKPVSVGVKPPGIADAVGAVGEVLNIVGMVEIMRGDADDLLNAVSQQVGHGRGGIDKAPVPGSMARDHVGGTLSHLRQQPIPFGIIGQGAQAVCRRRPVHQLSFGGLA